MAANGQATASRLGPLDSSYEPVSAALPRSDRRQGAKDWLSSSLLYHSTPTTKTMNGKVRHSFSNGTHPEFNSHNGASLYQPSEQDSFFRETENVNKSPSLSVQPQTSSFTKTSLSPSKFLEIEASTIHRQRRELQLLIAELKDRDRELNDMVSSHHKQLISCEGDRQKVLLLEKQNSKLKAQLKRASADMKQLKEKFQKCQLSHDEKQAELKRAKDQLVKSMEKINSSSQGLTDIQDKNNTLVLSVQELSAKVGQMEAQKQELVMALKIKENDIHDASHRLKEFTDRLKDFQRYKQTQKEIEGQLSTERDHWKEKCKSLQMETKKLEGEMNRSANSNSEQTNELTEVKKESLMLQKELFLAGEREKRKDQLLELSKSKQERLQTELQHIRQLYERQQRDVLYLQQQTSNNQWMDLTDRLSDVTWDPAQSSFQADNEQETLLESEAADRRHERRSEATERPSEDVDVTATTLDNLYLSPYNQPFPQGDHSSQPKPLDSSTVNHSPDRTEEPRDHIQVLHDVSASSSPTARLHKLLTESRKMVESLEQSSGESNSSSPHDDKLGSPLLHLSVDTSWTTISAAE